ncbi:MAG: polysaccharide biosynthesis/export family protein [Hyphomicrobiaceae bacterium]
MNFRRLLLVAGVAVAGLAGACAKIHQPANNNPFLYDKERGHETGSLRERDASLNRQRAANGPFGASLKDDLSFFKHSCPPAGTSDYIDPGPRGRTNSLNHRELTMRYSTGDRFNVQVPGAPEFSGDFVVNADGRVILPFAGEIPVRGVTNDQLTKDIERALIKAKLFEAPGFKIAVRPVQYAPINVTVSGAVFLRGRFTINADHPTAVIDTKALTKTGDSPLDRFVGASLRAANGVRPDADLAHIRLTRGGKSFMLNWAGAITGEPVDDVPLLDGDHIHVGESTCFQSALVRPSQITLGGVRIFMSNLTQPALHNSGSAINKDSSGVPYGTRLLAGAVAANCVGGSLASNAGRYAILITRNPKTKETEVIQRSIEELVLSPDRDTINPYLMPDDAIACYDSAITDAREIAGTLSAILAPFQTYSNIINAGATSK